MDLTELPRVLDSVFLINDSKTDEYKATAKEFPNNFIAQIPWRVSSFVDKLKTNEGKKREIDITYKVLGNVLRMMYNPRDKSIAAYLNGKEVYSGKLGNDDINSIISSLVKKEMNGEIDVDRPDRKDLTTDRQDLSPDKLNKKSFKFPRSVYNQMLKADEGIKNALKRNYKSQPLLTEKEYNYLVSKGKINEDDYSKENGFYVNNKNTFFEVKGDYGNLVQNLDEAVAREEGLYDFYEDNEYNSKPAVIFYKPKDEVYFLRKGELIKK